ncbi:hypothetical protein B0A48_18318 [Cryoendolithus antarcticus]|uniref:Uncharacterized protein n=1 Tax=Cryoendolithus antarcticus TaxID=1507870 RepID=A0A1V8S9F2_9PEZI|nr:hypothetical protein B0A48_18318 [Cryoendolithus antarcticus]
MEPAQADFPAHKGGCKQSQQRKALYRAAEEMQACFYVVQRVAFTINIAEVSVLPNTGKLRVIEATQTGERAPFPDHKFTDIGEQAKPNLLATISVGTDHMEANMNALRYMKRDPALKDIAESATAIEQQDSRSDSHGPHIVLRLPLGKESYALDLAGAGVGITQPIVPWKIYDKVLGNMFVTMKSSVMTGMWTKNSEERIVTKSHHHFNTMQLSGVTDTGMSYSCLMQAQTYEEVQDLVLAEGTATYAAILGGKREGFARFLSDVLQTFETRLNELEASPSGQH